MICKNLKTDIKYNYSFQEDKVRLWNPTKKPFFISYEQWNKEYLIIDKWLKL